MNRFLLFLFCIGAVAAVGAVGPPTVEAHSGPDGAILLKWNKVGDLFAVYRGDTFDTAQEIARVAGVTYTDYPGVNGQTYYYWVCVISESGEGESQSESESPPSLPVSAVCDREAPGLTIASPVNGARITGTLTIEGTATDGETGVNQVEVFINGRWYKASGTSTWQLSVVPPEGEVSITCRAQDKAGNTTEKGITVFVESISPEIVSVTPNEVACNTPVSVQIAGRNFGSPVQVIIGRVSCTVSASTDTAITVAVPPLKEGVYDVSVINPDGKSDTLFAAFTVFVDNTPPVIVTVTAVPQFVPNNGTTTCILTAHVEDAEGTVTVVVDLTSVGGGIIAMRDDGVVPDRTAGDSLYTAQTVVTKEIPEGDYTLVVTATDEEGETDYRSLTIHVIKDPPDNPPVLSNYQVTPSSGTTTTIFRYTVTYTDEDNNAPTYVTITITGVGTFNMVEQDPSDYTYMDGKNYYYDYSGLGAGVNSYTISASDGTNPVSIGATGPTVSGSNTPPALSSNSVTPSSGIVTTNFRYTVTYTDADNDDPVSITITITGVGTFNMVELNTSDQYFVDGKVYYYDYTAGLPAAVHSYTITADDGTDTTSLGGTGPTVTADPNTPPALSNASVTPGCGNTSTVFIYQVTYTDQDNDDPVSITITITGVGTFNMADLDPSDQYYENGKVYYYVYTGGFPIGVQSYTITADDGTDTTSLGGTGPEIPVGDCAPPPPPPSPLINIFPIAGPSGIWVTVTGTGFSANENNITITFDGTNVVLTPLGTTSPGTSPGTVRADASGNFSAKFRVPSSSPGSKIVDAHGDTTPALSVPNRIFTIICMPLPPYPPPPSVQPPTDTISPNSIITYPKSSQKIKGTSIRVKGTASDNSGVVKVEVSFDNGITWRTATGTTTWSYKWQLPTDGIYTIRSRATDDEGNIELVGGRVTVIIDNTAPFVTIDTELAPIEKENSFELTGTASDNDTIIKIEITTDGGNTWVPLPKTGTWTYQWNPADGDYTLQVRAYDDVGHIGYSQLIEITIDTVPPELYIDTPDGKEVTAGEILIIKGTANDSSGIDYVEIQIGEEGIYERAEGTENWSYLWEVPEQTGDYPVYVRAWDMAGHATFQEITITVVEPGGTFDFDLGLPLPILIVLAALIGAAVVIVIFYFRR